MQTANFDPRKLWLAQMGAEATLGPKSARADRVQVVLSLPFDASLLQHDPERPTFSWTAEDDVAVRRLTRLYSLLESPDLNPRPGNRLRSSGAGSNRWGPCAIQDRVVIRWAAL